MNNIRAGDSSAATSAPKLSVVIPLYNKRATIRRAIQSVITQQTPDIEIIVVDDGSTDGSAAEVEAIQDPRITLIRQANAGPGRARNVGAAQARADLLAFLDGDDEWKPGFLATGLAALASHPEAVAYACSFDSGAFSGRVKDKVSLLTQAPALLPPPTVQAGANWMKFALDGLHSSATIVRRSAFRTAGGYYDRDRCLWGEDSYLWGQVLFMGPVYWDPVARINFHVENSALGFAVQDRDRERPLATFGYSIMQSMEPEHRPAFFMLAQKTALDDSISLANSGHLTKCLALQRKYRLLSPRTTLRSAKCYLKFLTKKIGAKR